MPAKRSAGTFHHNIPTSVGGSDHEINRVYILRPRHARFHEWADNVEPASLIRKIAEDSVFHPHAFSPEQLQTIIQITTLQDWSRLYVSDALLPVPLLCGIKYAVSSTEFVTTHMFSEVVLLREKIHALLNGGEHSSQSSIMREALFFFKEKNPRFAIERLLTEETRGHKLMWTNPLLPITRDSLLKAISYAPSKDGRHNTQAYVDILSQQEMILRGFIDLRNKAMEKFRAWFVRRFTS